AAVPVSAPVRRAASTVLIRTVSPPRRGHRPVGSGRPAAGPRLRCCRAVPHTRYSAPAGPLIGHGRRPHRWRDPAKTAPARWRLKGVETGPGRVSPPRNGGGVPVPGADLAALLTRVARGDHAAFAEVYDRV